VQDCTGEDAFSRYQRFSSEDVRVRPPRKAMTIAKLRVDCGRLGTYFCWVGGVEGRGVGAGCVLTGCDFTSCNTELEPPRLAA
jgi:hypothetical protein